MIPIPPPRAALRRLTEAAASVAPVTTIGVSQVLDTSRVVVLYSSHLGVGAFTFDEAALPEVLRPHGRDDREAARSDLIVDADHVIEWQLDICGFGRLVSTPLSGVGPAARLWVGLADAAPVTVDAGSFHDVAAMAARLLVEPLPPAVEMDRLRRLERANAVLPILFQQLDVREVFDRLSTIGQDALRHDTVLLTLWKNDDVSQMTVYAAVGGDVQPSSVHPRPYSVAWTEALSFDLLDDRPLHPLERDRLPTRMGARTSLRFPIKFGGHLIGGISFNLSTPDGYSSDDIIVGQRLADYVGMALSHQALAEDERRTAEIRERTANLETLDGMLATLTGVLDIREVFDRVSAIGNQVMPHDAMTILVPTATPGVARVYAATGELSRLEFPQTIRSPRPEMFKEGWDCVFINDTMADPLLAETPAVRVGMRSILMVPIRLEGELRGTANFLSRQPGRFGREDLPIARRIADYVALALSHQRLAEQIRSSEALRVRTTNMELLDELLAALADSGELRDVIGRVSEVAGKVLPHDGMAVPVMLPDGAHVRFYVCRLPHGAMETQEAEIPEYLRRDDWDYDIIDDIQALPDQQNLPAARLGWRSVLRIPIRVEGRLAAGVAFLSAKSSAYTHDDVAIGRRIAERLGLSLIRERGLEVARRADEATARASKLEARVRALTEELDARTGYRRVVGESRQWRQVLVQATQVAATDTTVLLLGESGTGKEVVARFLHRASPRSNGPFVALNCAALPEQLLEAELFGYERGAYTGATQSKPGQLEQAAGGTLFLDEVGEMSPSVQAKFLRVLQEREFQRLGGTRVLRTDVRVVAATNRDLQRAIARGQFRDDLYYRLNVFAIQLPALRERPDDIMPLSEGFLGEIGKGLGRPPAGISRDAREMLTAYSWPGNVRELRNILERAAILCEGGLITTEHLALTLHTVAQPVMPVESNPAPTPARSAADIQSMERAMIEQALQDARFNKSKAAKALGLTRQQLYVRLRKYGLES